MSPSIPPVPIPSSARPTWSSLPSTRCSKKWQPHIKNWDEVAAYQEAAARKSDFERGELNKDKTGVRLDGIEVINPVNGKVVPMFVSDYVLMGYGTGIVMGVPGHDQRDWDFANEVRPAHRRGGRGRRRRPRRPSSLKDDTGIMVNSGFLNGMTVKEAIPAMKKYAVEQGCGQEKVNYKLRDWVFSRQRYWGEPIPLVNCAKCGWVPVPEERAAAGAAAGRELRADRRRREPHLPR